MSEGRSMDAGWGIMQGFDRRRGFSNQTMSRLGSKKTVKLTMIIGLTLVMWLSLSIPLGRAARLYQTVPTMPPPTTPKTATATQGLHITPSSTSQPTATGLQKTAIPPSRTPTTTPTATVLSVTQVSITPAITATLPGPMVSEAVIAPFVSQTTTQNTLTATLLPPEEGNVNASGNELGLSGLIGGGVVLLAAVITTVWLSRRTKSQP